jgi:ATP dependent DNA ligase domain
MAMSIKGLPAGFIFPAQPVLRLKPPAGADWVHEIKRDGYRMIVHRDGPTVRLYSRNAYDWTARLAGIAAAAERIKAKSFTIDGEAVVLGPDGLSRFEDLSHREAVRTAILYGRGFSVGLNLADTVGMAKKPEPKTPIVWGKQADGGQAVTRRSTLSGC